MSIATQNISVGGNDDVRVVARNAQGGQLLSIGTSWTTIRIGGRFSWGDLGVNLTGKPNFSLGVMTTPSAGMANGLLNAAAATHFLGVRSYKTVWTRAAGPPVRYDISGVDAIYYAKIVDGVLSGTSISPTTRFSADTSRRWPYMVEITKGSPNFSLSFLYPSGAALDDISEAVMVDAMDSATLAAAETVIEASVANSVGYTVATTAVAVDEAADGDLNSICMAWDRAYPSLYASELLFYKVA